MLKSIFITGIVTVAILVMLFLGYEYYNYGFDPLSLCAFANASIIALFFGVLFTFTNLITYRHQLPFSVPIYLVTIAAIILFFILPYPNVFYFLLCIGLCALWLLYLYWYSSLPKATKSLKVGDNLPDFDLENTQGQSINSSNFKGKPSIFLFYRGNWCPLCTVQIKDLAKQYQQIEKLGAQVVLVSPQPHSSSESLAKKHDVNFNFMVDVNNNTAKQLGILHENGLPAGFQVLGYDSDTVLPTVIVTDASGKIIFYEQSDNYRLRPEPDVFLKVLGN